MNVEIIRNTLYRAYLEDFYKFCKHLGGTTAEVMGEILAVSDFNIINYWRKFLINNFPQKKISVWSRSPIHHYYDQQFRYGTFEGRPSQIVSAVWKTLSGRYQNIFLTFLSFPRFLFIVFFYILVYLTSQTSQYLIFYTILRIGWII